MEARFKETSFATFSNGRFDGVLYKTHFMSAHVILNIDTEEVAFQPGTT